MLDKQLARHLESIRHQHELSLAEVAEASGVSRATLSRIERAETSPTASVLGRLCSTYGITMSRLMMKVESASPRHLLFADAKTWEDPETGYKRTVISPPTHDYAIEIAHGELPPGADVRYQKPPQQGLEQHLVLISGALNVSFDGADYSMSRLDCVALKLRGRSRFRNLGEVPASYLIINGQA
ncbi:XRE family transcriptional regulator [Arenicella xantha]|uniref:XRE family transcriptional regulator n=1 Tax=Arenicella xantha TaxID=644221 RepID=A0A395JKB0_9GAMM|nr:XRE family transcriptional regulator [Arenicella xantha]RBP51172.1 XRE family transcriptional regulator [Arenicella xantha]